MIERVKVGCDEAYLLWKTERADVLIDELLHYRHTLLAA